MSEIAFLQDLDRLLLAVLLDERDTEKVEELVVARVRGKERAKRLFRLGETAALELGKRPLDLLAKTVAEHRVNRRFARACARLPERLRSLRALAKRTTRGRGALRRPGGFLDNEKAFGHARPAARKERDRT
ncbi:MAG: hypothetical protein RML56_14855 [Burkholderiales bacterium]|nr:hypothetical protein [Burkholderiales bacterium]